MIFTKIIYACQQGWKYRKSLRCFIIDPKLRINSILEHDPQVWFKEGIKGIILDFDGVLAAHSEPEPRAEVSIWLNNLYKNFGPHYIFILSNQPTEQRNNYFKKYYPGVLFLTGVKGKPYPDGIFALIKKSGLSPKELLLIDDRLLTGILAAMIAGIQARWVAKPYQDIRFYAVREKIIQGFRWAERILVSCK